MGNGRLLHVCISSTKGIAKHEIPSAKLLLDYGMEADAHAGEWHRQVSLLAHAKHLLEKGRPAGTPDRIALPVAGDDPKSKAIVMKLVDQLGFDAVDDGTLDDSWRQQPGTPVYGTDLNAEGVRRALAEASRKRSPEFQATEKSPGTYAKPA